MSMRAVGSRRRIYLSVPLEHRKVGRSNRGSLRSLHKKGIRRPRPQVCSTGIRVLRILCLSCYCLTPPVARNVENRPNSNIETTQVPSIIPSKSFRCSYAVTYPSRLEVTHRILQHRGSNPFHPACHLDGDPYSGPLNAPLRALFL